MPNEITIPDATLEPLAYRDALLTLLGDRDPVEVLSMTSVVLPGLLESVSDDAARARPREVEWSASELLGHFFDVELVFGFRLRLTLTEDTPSYPGYNEKEWARLPKPSLQNLVDSWRALRETNLCLLRATPRTEWSRTGIHSEQGSEGFELNVRKLAGHDLAHLNQMERILSGPGGRRQYDSRG